ncbi:MAG: hypothetical protein IKW77_07115 [Salinivirgaceae bacterium]|nr:hypothetical protein [Salinivirgaceae bacterium]
MLLDLENLERLLLNNGIDSVESEQIFIILKKAKRNHHGKIESIDIPQDKESLFWGIIGEFENLHYQWGNNKISFPQLSSSLNDIVAGKGILKHNYFVDNNKKYLLLNDKSNGFRRLEMPNDISIDYKLHFYYFPTKKEIIVKRYPAIKKTCEPKYDYINSVLTVERRVVNLEPHLTALYVLFLENIQGIKKEELNNIYEQYKKLYDEIYKAKVYEQMYKCPTKDSFVNNFTKYISKLNTNFEELGIIMPLYFIRQYECKNQGEKYFLAINFINSDKVKRR